MHSGLVADPRPRRKGKGDQAHLRSSVRRCEECLEHVRLSEDAMIAVLTSWGRIPKRDTMLTELSLQPGESGNEVGWEFSAGGVL